MLVALALLLTAAAPEGASAPRLLIVDLEVHGADPALRVPTTGLVVRSVAELHRFDVVAGDDVRRALDLAAAQQAAGCDATSCLDEVAGALGARFVLFGDLSRAGDDAPTTLTLHLFDNNVLRSIARVDGELDGDGGDATVVARLARRLVRDYDAYTGAFPWSRVVGLSGAAVAVGGGVVVGLAGWQLGALADDKARHDRLLADFKATRDQDLVDQARTVQQSADGHGLAGGLLLAVGLPALVVGLGAAGWGALVELDLVE